MGRDLKVLRMLLCENTTQADSLGNKGVTNCQSVSPLNFVNYRGKDNKVSQELQS
jgi:hypothetical protein